MQKNNKKRISNAKSNIISGIISILVIAGALVYFFNKGMYLPMWEKVLMFSASGLWFGVVVASIVRSAKILKHDSHSDPDGECDGS